MCVCAHLFLSGWEQLSKTGVRSSPSRIRSSGGLMPARTRLVVNRSMTLANWKFTYRQEKKINGSSKIRCSTHTYTHRKACLFEDHPQRNTLLEFCLLIACSHLSRVLKCPPWWLKSLKSRMSCGNMLTMHSHDKHSFHVWLCVHTQEKRCISTASTLTSACRFIITTPKCFSF